MASDKKIARPKARLPRGFRDRSGAEIAAERELIEKIRKVYESYGFSPLETPTFEYTDALGKFLPDVDRPNEGVFSLKDDDEQWLSLRYDLTAPLARYVAENFQFLPKPFRRYQTGLVYRNEKPGPGRYREFTQFDADTVGSNSPAADAELLMMLCDALEAVNLDRGDYVVKFNSRELLDGMLEAIGLDAASSDPTRLIVLRALDKFDRFGANGVRCLLGQGRKDESGDFTRGAGLTEQQIDVLMMLFEIQPQPNRTSLPTPPQNNPLLSHFVQLSTDTLLDSAYSRVHFDHDLREFVNEIISEPAPDALPISNHQTIAHLRSWLPDSDKISSALRNLELISDIALGSGYGTRRIRFDPSIIRGLDYYTGPVFEAQLTFRVKNDEGQEVVFGSVAGGGRYDNLVARFTGQQVPATGISIGVSRLLTALRSRGVDHGERPLVIVLLMDSAIASFALARDIRDFLRDPVTNECLVRTEAYVGTKKVQDQLKYADKRGAVLAIIEGEEERKIGKVKIKDLGLGAELSKHVETRSEWVNARAGEETVEKDRLPQSVWQMLQAIAARQNRPKVV